MTLHGGGLVGSIGVREGQLLLFPEPDEDPEIWRRRSEQAWVGGPDIRIDAMRMEEIAYATRLEVMFKLLDGEGIHFRFEAGPLPQPGSVSAPASSAGDGAESEFRDPPRLGPSAPGAVHCSPISVEFLLLEHARLGDECRAHGDYNQVSRHDVPRVLDAGSPPPSMERFWHECDGVSNVIEIADRLSWPMRRCQAAVLELIVRGLVRIAHSREMLVLAAREIAAGRFARAASRLSGWVHHSPPGPPPQGDVELLVAEWHGGRLPVVLASMEASFARTLLRRMDLVQLDWKESIGRWQELRKHQTHDLVSEVRLISCRTRSSDEADAPTLNHLLRIARSLQDVGHSRRAGVILRVAAQGLPETTSMRLELGTRMLAVGMVEEGTPWVVEAAHALIDSGLAEKAIQPLRTILEGNPRHREARQLLTLAQARSAAGRRRRRNTLIGMSVLLLVSLGAMVEMQIADEFEQRLAEISDHASQPSLALNMLEERFPEADQVPVLELREALVRSLRVIERNEYEAWIDRYRDCQLECTMGDPMLGLQRTLEMPEPIEQRYLHEVWPPVSDLFSALAGQLEQSVAEWDPPVEQVPVAEERLGRLIAEMHTVLDESDTPYDVAPFQKRLENLSATLTARESERERLVQRRLKGELVGAQDLLLTQARREYARGELAAAVQTFEELFALPGGEKLKRVLGDEYGAARRESDALYQAVALAEGGLHAEAVGVLRRNMHDPRLYLLPWQVTSWPTAARVELSDGTVRETPFQLFSAIDQVHTLEFELEGFEPFRLRVDEPADQHVRLTVSAQINWTLANRVEAPPVTVGTNYVLCDRAGHVTCVSQDGTELWSHTLDALGGVARAPIFLPKKEGYLLCLTEDGDTYLIDAAGGQLQGPWSMDAVPIAGPVATSTGVVAYFDSGKVAEWDRRLAPTISTASRAPDESLLFGSDCGLRILRNNGMRALELESHDRSMSVTIEADVYLVHEGVDDATGTPRKRFAVRRSGDWVYVAWEAPRSDLLRGRLWISDGAGLRGIEP